jgi:sulfite reductase alpha subunit-like flavoprotein
LILIILELYLYPHSNPPIQPKDLFQDVPFSVLALGDTNYDKFCNAGKSIDKRLVELGGKRVLDLYCADEATNLEETVEEWKEKVFEVIVKTNEDDLIKNLKDVAIDVPEETKVNKNVLF